MKNLTLIFVILSFVELSDQDVSSYKWQNRIILISGLTQSDFYQKQLKTLNEIKFKNSLQERKLIIIETNSTNSSTAAFNIKIIGLDGGVKLCSNEPISSNTIIELIDSMPMRMAEMRRKHNNY